MTFDLSINDWLEAVASRNPTPGGGAVAAHLGAQSTALFAMVCRYSKNGDFGSQFINSLDASTQRFLELGRADEVAYQTLMTSLKTERKNGSDPVKIDAIYLAAAEPPLMIFELAAKIARQFCAVRDTTNQNLASDTSMVALMLDCTMRCAELNIHINLDACKDAASTAAYKLRVQSHLEARETLKAIIDQSSAQ